MITEEWWCWRGAAYDVDEHNCLHFLGYHYELYAVRLEDDKVTALAGPVRSGAANELKATKEPPVWPCGRLGGQGRRGRTTGDDPPFLSHPGALHTLERRRNEFTRTPREVKDAAMSCRSKSCRTQ